MADIQITDSAHLTADLKISDSSSFSLAKLSGLNFNSLPVVGDLNKPIDQSALKRASFGAKFQAPSFLIGDGTQFSVQAAVTGTLSLRQASNSTVFDDDDKFAPSIPISAGECWVGCELQTSLTAKAAASFDGFGVEVKDTSGVGLGTYVRLKQSSGALPLLSEGLKIAFESYSADRSVASLRSLKPGIIQTTSVSGVLKLSASYAFPITVNPLASASLPFNYQLTVTPQATLGVVGELALSGEFIVRAYKSSETQLVLAVYKKKETTLGVKFTVAAGVAANAGEFDVLTAFRQAVFPATTAAAAGFTGEDAEALNGALKECLDYSLTSSVNGACSASRSDESALVYVIDLTVNAASTDRALAAALHGDWTSLSSLPNAALRRNIFAEVQHRRHQTIINLLGFYNAASIDEYVKSFEVLRDPNGPIVLIDKARASRVRAAGSPHLADAEKLRSALAESFLATVTYAASGVGASRLALKDFTVQQTYTRYQAHMPAQVFRRQVLLGRALHLISDSNLQPEWDRDGSFDHAKAAVSARYNSTSSLRMFFRDPSTRAFFQRQQLERVGREALARLLDPREDNAPPRLAALADDALWTAMNESGNVATFQTIPTLRRLSATAQAAISADWIDIRWWSEAMLGVTPKLSQLLDAVAQSSAADPTLDANFMRARKALEQVLATVAANARAAFADGWGLLVMFDLSGGAPAVEMDLNWNGKSEHFTSPGKAASALAV
jgi:hypothetical protein